MTFKFAKLADVSTSNPPAYAIVLDITSNPSDGPRCPADTQIGHRYNGQTFTPFDFDTELPAIKKQAKLLVDDEFEEQLVLLMDRPSARKEQVFKLEVDWAWGYLTNHPLKAIYKKHLDATRDGVTDTNSTTAEIAMKVLINDQIFRQTAAIATGHRRNVEKRIEACTSYMEILQLIQSERDNAGATFARFAQEIGAFVAEVPALMQAAINQANAS